jgi:tRNA(Ile)-lysidine synthase
VLRGAGLKGLTGMPAVQGPVIRPLIQVSRRDLLAFLQAGHIPYRQDPSNRQRRYTRNRLRLEALPWLQRHYNPHLPQALCAMARLLAADEAALQAVADERFRAARLPGDPGEVRLRIDHLKAWLPALQRRVVREALREVCGSLHGFTQRHVAAVLRLCGGSAGSKALSLPHHIIAERRYQVLHLRRLQAPPVAPAPQPLPIPGRCALAALGLAVESRLLDREALSPPFPTGQVAWLDAAAVGPALWVRTRRPGDRFQPLGCPYVKKLKAFLIDAKVPRSVRDQLPLVVTERGIAWVAGVQVADWAKVTAATRRVLGLQVIPQACEPLAAPEG